MGNQFVIEGTVAAPPEERHDPYRLRVLVAVEQTSPRRVDVLPVELPDPTPEQVATVQHRATVTVAGQVRRRFTVEDGRRVGEIVLVAEAVRLHPANPPSTS